MEIYKNNIVKCKKCGYIIKVEFKNSEDFTQRYLHWCKCGLIAIDPSPYLWRILCKEGEIEDCAEDLSEKADERFLAKEVQRD